MKKKRLDKSAWLKKKKFCFEPVKCQIILVEVLSRQLDTEAGRLGVRSELML